MSEQNPFEGIATTFSNALGATEPHAMTAEDFRRTFDLMRQGEERDHERAVEWGRRMREDPEYRRGWEVAVSVIGYEPRAGSTVLVSKAQYDEIHRRLALTAADTPEEER